jgi:hypothetical protein
LTSLSASSREWIEWHRSWILAEQCLMRVNPIIDLTERQQELIRKLRDHLIAEGVVDRRLRYVAKAIGKDAPGQVCRASPRVTPRHPSRGGLDVLIQRPSTASVRNLDLPVTINPQLAERSKSSLGVSIAAVALLYLGIAAANYAGRLFS